MSTPFDAVIENIRKVGYHNHRLETHSDIVSQGIVNDLIAMCPALQRDIEEGVVVYRMNVQSPGDRKRKVDLFVGEPGPDGEPDLNKVRVAVENKSVVTAHRNKDARFDDLKKVLQAIYQEKAEAIVVATVLIGLAEQVLNVPDELKKRFRQEGRLTEFEERVVPRLSRGDQALWAEFGWAISKNRKDDAKKTAELFLSLPQRESPGMTHVTGYDFVLLVPVFIDNVNPPSLPRPNPLGVDVDQRYQAMLTKICKAYSARWHA